MTELVHCGVELKTQCITFLSQLELGEVTAFFQLFYCAEACCAPDKANKEEKDMLDTNMLYRIVLDLVNRGYTLHGIASDLHLPEDVVFDIISKVNTNPSIETGIKLVKLHRQVCNDVYEKYENTLKNAL
jgi:hypothetical protein